MPVTGVSRWEALADDRWVRKTLPTEVEWEYTCAGPNGNTYPWGEQEPTLAMANFAPYSDPVTREPTTADAHPQTLSAFGARDMAGNFAGAPTHLRPPCGNNRAVDGHLDPLPRIEESRRYVCVCTWSMRS